MTDTLATDSPPLEARVLGAMIARPWLIDIGLRSDDFSDERNRAVHDAIWYVQANCGPLPQSAADMGLAVMRCIDGTPAAERVDLTYLASLVLIAELALGSVSTRVDAQAVCEWFDAACDDLRAASKARAA